MEDETQKIRETTVRSGDTTQKTTELNDPVSAAEHQQNVAERAIWYIAGVLLVLLGFRFLLALLGANASNGFANFIYSTSRPFVTPFFSLFNYNNYGLDGSRFELYTLVAIVFYTLVAWGIAKLVTLNRN